MPLDPVPLDPTPLDPVPLDAFPNPPLDWPLDAPPSVPDPCCAPLPIAPFIDGDCEFEPQAHATSRSTGPLTLFNFMTIGRLAALWSVKIQ
jgi:hypothetical protein